MKVINDHFLTLSKTRQNKTNFDLKNEKATKTHLSKNPKPLFPGRELKKQIVGFFFFLRS